MSRTIPYLLCRESTRLGSHFGIILDPFGAGLGGFKTVFSGHLGPREIRQKFAYIVPWGVWGAGPQIAPWGVNRIGSQTFGDTL